MTELIAYDLKHAPLFLNKEHQLGKIGPDEQERMNQQKY